MEIYDNMMKSVFIGCGAYLPQNCVSNDDLSAKVDTSDEWILQRTGISERRVLESGRATSDLSLIHI